MPQILRSGHYRAECLYFFVEIAMLERVDHQACYQAVQRPKIRHAPRTLFHRPPKRYRNLVIVAVPERVVALAIKRPVLFGSKLRSVQPVRCRKAVLTGHQHGQAASPKYSTYRSGVS